MVKRKVVEAAFNAAILYGCEAWLDVGLKPLETLYMSAIKMLLGVRPTTPNDICLIEAGMPPLKALVHKRQHMFFNKIWRERSEMTDDPLIFVLKLTNMGNKKMANYIKQVKDEFDMNEYETNLRQRFNASGSKFQTYKAINPELITHKVYARKYEGVIVPEHYRMAFTRMRTSAHRLRIETGRWARTARQFRICPCGNSVQTEEHVLTECAVTQNLRDAYNGIVMYPNILREASAISDFKFIFDVLNCSE